jgi:hypothetical protein
VAIGIAHPNVHFEVVYGVSGNTRTWYENSNAERLGYRPQDNSESYAAEVLTRANVADELADDYQGGQFVYTKVVALLLLISGRRLRLALRPFSSGTPNTPEQEPFNKRRLSHQYSSRVTQCEPLGRTADKASVLPASRASRRLLPSSVTSPIGSLREYQCSAPIYANRPENFDRKIWRNYASNMTPSTNTNAATHAS